MNAKLTRIALIFLLGAAAAAYAQDGEQTWQKAEKPQKATPAQSATPKPVVFTTAPKLTVAKLRTGEADAYDVRGKLSFTVTAANSNDTVAGAINYTIPDDARRKIASLTGKPLSGVPSSITHRGAIAAFQKMAAAPIIHLEISPMDVDVAGAKMRFNRIVLDINARESSDTKFTNDEMESLFTSWARQIAAGRLRRGVIAMINRRIAGEDDQ
ncbi:MAG TPA: hypothetical protein VE715_04730 [Blastocatellia bacterium]|nr:hypothetical protein [Blastocatellia bacterium]